MTIPASRIFQNLGIPTAMVNANDVLQTIYEQLKELERIRNEGGFTYPVVVKGNVAAEVYNILMGIEKIEPCQLKADFDLIFFYPRMLRDEMNPKVDGRILELAEAIQQSPLFARYNMCENIETIRFLKNQTLIEAINAALTKRDMTRNEIFLKLENGQMMLYLTAECIRDTLDGVALLGTGNPSTTRFNHGEIAPLPYGVARMLRAIVERKANKMYLSKEDISTLWQASAPYEPMGVYGIQLCERYSSHKIYQDRMMQLLISLGLTKTKTFNAFRSKMETEYIEKTGKAYDIRERTFLEVLTSRKEAEERVLAKRQGRNIHRKSCQHDDVKTKIIQCGKAIYIVDYCPECNECHIFDPANREIRADQLPTNQILASADIERIPGRIDAEKIIQALCSVAV